MPETPSTKTSRSREKESLLPQGVGQGGKDRQSPIELLLTAVIQTQDQRKTEQALTQMGMTVVRFASSGGFLGQRNVTLLIGAPANRLDEALSVIHEHCHQRVEYISTPLEGAPMPIPIATPITVGGATVFALQVERFEEF